MQHCGTMPGGTMPGGHNAWWTQMQVARSRTDVEVNNFFLDSLRSRSESQQSIRLQLQPLPLQLSRPWDGVSRSDRSHVHACNAECVVDQTRLASDRLQCRLQAAWQLFSALPSIFHAVCAAVSSDQEEAHNQLYNDQPRERAAPYPGIVPQGRMSVPAGGSHEQLPLRPLPCT